MSMLIASSLGTTPGSTRPLFQARCRTRSLLIPRPSSSMRIRMAPVSCCALSTSLPAGVACSDAFLGRLQTVVERIAHQVHERVGNLFDHRLVQFRITADDLKLTSLPRLEAVSRTTRRKRLNVSPTGTMRNASVPLRISSISAFMCWLDSAGSPAATHAPTWWPRTGNDQFAQQIDHASRRSACTRI